MQLGSAFQTLRLTFGALWPLCWLLVSSNAKNSHKNVQSFHIMFIKIWIACSDDARSRHNNYA